MKRTLIKTVIFIFLALFLNNSVFAVNSEFKNTLLNIDLVKVSDDSYSINLYTSKKYNSPVKVIKKSDLSYYILLPETKNISPKVVTTLPEIRNVNAVLYPYAGVDVNNGYTKININTTKPVNFGVAVKNSTTQAADTTNVLTSSNQEAKVQKKNSQFAPKRCCKTTT